MSKAKLKSLSSYLEERMEEFNYGDFAPDNHNQIYGRLKDVFYKDTPFWNMQETEGSLNFEIKFKTYGDKRKNMVLIFSLKLIELELILYKDNPCGDKEGDTKSISLSNIWLDHSKLLGDLKELMTEGLNDQ